MIVTTSARVWIYEMDTSIVIFIITIILQNILDCRGSSLSDQLERILRTRKFSDDYTNDLQISRRSEDDDNADELEINMQTRKEEIEDLDNYLEFRRVNDNQDEYSGAYKLLRRFYEFHPGMGSTILGTPSMPSHLPEAEPILPGHTLIRPALGMLKSAVKFPHKDLDNGAGVYGNIDSLGITYDGTGERVLYTGFRRQNDITRYSRPRYAIILLRSSGKKSDGENLNLTLEQDEDEEEEVLSKEAIARVPEEEESEQQNQEYRYPDETIVKPIARIRDYHKLELERQKKRQESNYNLGNGGTNNYVPAYPAVATPGATVEANGIVMEFIHKPKPMYAAPAAQLNRQPMEGHPPRVVTPRTEKLAIDAASTDFAEVICPLTEEPIHKQTHEQNNNTSHEPLQYGNNESKVEFNNETKLELSHDLNNESTLSHELNNHSKLEEDGNQNAKYELQDKNETHDFHYASNPEVSNTLVTGPEYVITNETKQVHELNQESRILRGYDTFKYQLINKINLLIQELDIISTELNKMQAKLRKFEEYRRDDFWHLRNLEEQIESIPRITLPKVTKPREIELMYYDSKTRPNIDFYSQLRKSKHYGPIRGVKKY